MAGAVEAPEVIDRRAVALHDRQAYHAAGGLPLDRAEKLISDAVKVAHRRAKDAVGNIVKVAARVGTEVGAGAVLMSAYQGPSTLAATLRSHPACHAAEGQMTRDAFIAACDALGLEVVTALEREIDDVAAAALGLGPATLAARVKEMGVAVGSPWRKPEKQAAMAAWLALV